MKALRPIDRATAWSPPPCPRDPAVLMTPRRLAALQPCRLSASRAMMGTMIRDRWSVRRLQFDIDERARGRALYRIETPGGIFDFPVFSFEYSPRNRTGRIIGRSWDMMAALIEGPASAAEIEATAAELPKLYEGRASAKTLAWCRSNRSSRVFNHTVEALSRGAQPDIATLAQSCYLMRNTGLDGNGTFGTRSFLALEADHPLREPLAAQVLGAYMMRQFAADLVHCLARHRSPGAVELDPVIQRFLGVGNGSALGLILFVNNHPKLIDRWLSAREAALVAAKSLPVEARSPAVARLVALLDRTITFRRQDRMHYDAFLSSAEVARELELVRDAAQDLFETGLVGGAWHGYPLAALADLLEPRVHAETHETLLALLIELVPDLADRLARDLGVDEELEVRPAMTAGQLRDIVRAEYAWAFAIDLDAGGADRYIWYKSANAEEPRRGPKEEVDWAINLGLDLPRLIRRLDLALADVEPRTSVARFLLPRPELRGIAARVQCLQGLRYHSPHMNIMGEDFVPIEIVRLMNVALHGIDKTRDYLNRNLRGVIYHGAPLPDDLRSGAASDWFNPAEPAP